MSNSPLVTYTRITKNKTSPRNHAIDTITIHCIVGQWTAKQGCDYFATTDRQCSANYVVGKDGSIGLSVDEKDRSWCSLRRHRQGLCGPVGFGNGYLQAQRDQEVGVEYEQE